MPILCDFRLHFKAIKTLCSITKIATGFFVFRAKGKDKAVQENNFSDDLVNYFSCADEIKDASFGFSQINHKGGTFFDLLA